MPWGSISTEPEVDAWFASLTLRQLGHVAFALDLLAEFGPLLGEPHTRQLDRKLRELRFRLEGQDIRNTYTIAYGRDIRLLTVFTKHRARERREIARAVRALRNFNDRQQPT